MPCCCDCIILEIESFGNKAAYLDWVAGCETLFGTIGAGAAARLGSTVGRMVGVSVLGMSEALWLVAGTLGMTWDS